MFSDFQPFGYEVVHLNDTITTATNKRFNLARKPFVKTVIRYTGLPHFGARLRAFHLRKLLTELPKNRLILDAGCGMGLNSFLALRCGHRVVGVDNDPEKIKLANTMKTGLGLDRSTFQKGDLTRLSLSSNAFDAVICFEVMEHIKRDAQAFKEISRVLRKNGLLFLSVPAKGIISRTNQHSKDHVREGYSFEEIKSYLAKNSMTIINTIKIEKTPLGFLVRYINDEVGKRSLGAVTMLFPIFLPLGVLDSLLPSITEPNNWIVTAKKNA